MSSSPLSLYPAEYDWSQLPLLHNCFYNIWCSQLLVQNPSINRTHVISINSIQGLAPSFKKFINGLVSSLYLIPRHITTSSALSNLRNDLLTSAYVSPNNPNDQQNSNSCDLPNPPGVQLSSRQFSTPTLVITAADSVDVFQHVTKINYAHQFLSVTNTSKACGLSESMCNKHIPNFDHTSTSSSNCTSLEIIAEKIKDYTIPSLSFSFHGTDSISKVQSILTDGFNPTLNRHGREHFGKGVYHTNSLYTAFVYAGNGGYIIISCYITANLTQHRDIVNLTVNPEAYDKTTYMMPLCAFKVGPSSLAQSNSSLNGCCSLPCPFLKKIVPFSDVFGTNNITEKNNNFQWRCKLYNIYRDFNNEHNYYIEQQYQLFLENNKKDKNEQVIYFDGQVPFSSSFDMIIVDF